MTFDIRTYQTSLWIMVGILVFFLAAAVIAALTLVTRVMSARMENTTRTLRGLMDGGVSPLKAIRLHKRLTVIALVLTSAMLLLMLSLLQDCRMNVVNDDTADVLTVTGQIELIEPRTLLDGTLLFHDGQCPTFGVRLTVDGTEYHALSAEGLSAGDAVMAQYLPRSRCVLYIGDGSSLPFPVVTPQASADAAEAAITVIQPVTTLTFPFEDYQRIVLFEAGLCIVLVIIAAHTVFSAAKKLLRHKLKLAEGLQTLLFIFTFALLLVVGCSSVWNGGWQLLFEEPAEAVTVRGEIQSIEVLGSYDGVKFSTERGTQFGCYVTIDDTAYFAVSAGDLAVGDAVLIEYLPKSRYVLYLAPLDAITQED